MASKEGLRLKEVLEDQWPKVRLGAFAERMGVSYVTLWTYMAGRVRAPRGFWLAAARELGIDPAELLSDREGALS